MEMVRMANVYLSENNIENAYILYIKFMVLFLEKIQSHPEYKTVPVNLKQPNQAKLKEIMPITEKLKERLKDRYEKEYAQFLARKIEEEKEAARRAKLKEKERNEMSAKINIQNITPADPSFVPASAPDLSLLDDVVYPNDFPTDPRSSAGTGGLLLPTKPTVDRSLKPSSSLIEGELRTVVIPSVLMEKFLSLAQTNTKNNVETCGILAGKLAANKFNITHVIVPKQNGTSDSCTTMNEEELFDYQDQYHLITLGWIHTHPSQTAFLSSVDLHTHCSYQIMMPEAIAIVCAPKYQT